MRAAAVAALTLIAVACLSSVALQAVARDSPVQIYSGTFNAGNLADGAGETTTLAIPGAVLGDACLASLGVSTAGMTVTCNITAASTASVRVQNESGGAVDLASTTLRVFIFRKTVY